MKPDWRQGVLYAAIMGMEGCWLYTLMAMFNKPVADGRLSIFGILLLYPLSFGLSGLMRRLPWPEFCRRTISLIAWALVMLFVVKIQLFGGLAWADTAWLLALPRAIAGVIFSFQPELLVLIGGTGVIWWLGQRLAYRKVNFATLVSEFQFGLIILVMAFFVASPLEAGIEHAIYLIFAFFLFGLLGISVAHALEGTSWLSGLYQGHWSGLLLVSISLILIIGLFISAVVTPDLLQLALAAIKWVWELVMKAIAFLVGLLPEPAPVALPPTLPGPAAGPEEPMQWFTMSEAVRNGLRLGWTVLVGGALIFALWRVSSDILQWLRRRLASMAGAEFEPMPGAFKADFLGLLKRILSGLLGLRWLWRRGSGAEAAQPEISMVRQVYRQLLAWAAAAGFPRHLSRTPHEYLYELAGRLPEARRDLELITQQYVRARYGAWLPTEDELHQLRQSWYNVKRNRPGDRRQ